MANVITVLLNGVYGHLFKLIDYKVGSNPHFLN